MMERLFQLKVSGNTGVSPSGAQVRARVGRVLNPLSSIKTMVRVCCRAFFLMPANPSAASDESPFRRVPPPGVRDVGN